MQQLYEFLSSAELTRDIGSRYEYSNLGAGLLGHALARRAGTDYETLVRKRILGPLGMKSTSITLSTSMKERLATGHDESLKPAEHREIAVDPKIFDRYVNGPAAIRDLSRERDGVFLQNRRRPDHVR